MISLKAFKFQVSSALLVLAHTVQCTSQTMLPDEYNRGDAHIYRCWSVAFKVIHRTAGPPRKRYFKRSHPTILHIRTFVLSQSHEEF